MGRGIKTFTFYIACNVKCEMQNNWHRNKSLALMCSHNNVDGRKIWRTPLKENHLIHFHNLNILNVFNNIPKNWFSRPKIGYLEHKKSDFDYMNCWEKLSQKTNQWVSMCANIRIPWHHILIFKQSTTTSNDHAQWLKNATFELDFQLLRKNHSKFL